ncbi:MAG: TIGR00266 family protein, partial [Nevskiaceae bacterium]
TYGSPPHMSSVPPAVAPKPAAPAAAPAALEHRIYGSDLQYVEITLQPAAAVVGEPGSMMYMDDGIEQETVLGDGSQQPFFVRMYRAFKRMFTGESMFSVIFTNSGTLPRRVAFATPTIGKVLAIDLAAIGGELICQKGAFLAAERGVEMGIAWTKKLRVGFFGGEGFIMQRLKGKGRVYINASGTLTEMNLPAGSTLRVDTGCLVALQSTVAYDIKYAGRVKTALFGGEGLFFASLRGPGKAWLQSLPMKRFAQNVFKAAVYGQQKKVLWLYVIGFIIFLIFIALGGDPGATQ